MNIKLDNQRNLFLHIIVLFFICIQKMHSTFFICAKNLLQGLKTFYYQSNFYHEEPNLP